MFLKSHRTHVEALVRQADALERRASNAAAEHIRRIETKGTVSQGNAELLDALADVARAGANQLAAIRNLHRLIVETAGSAPATTRMERRRVLRDMAEGVAAMERGVAEMEKSI